MRVDKREEKSGEKAKKEGGGKEDREGLERISRRLRNSIEKVKKEYWEDLQRVHRNLERVERRLRKIIKKI